MRDCFVFCVSTPFNYDMFFSVRAMMRDASFPPETSNIAPFSVFIPRGIKHAVEIWHLTGRKALPVRNAAFWMFLHDLFMQPLLDLRVSGEFVEGPGQEAGRRVPSSLGQVN